MSSLDCLDLCRLCLVKDSVSVPIFGGEGDARQIFLKIAACLPVKVARDDKLPKKICDQCVCKIELCYEFWNTTVNSEKQLIEWLGGSGVEDKQNYVSDVLNPNIMKQEQSNENRLDGTVMQVSGHQSNMAIGMMGNLALNMPIIISTSSQQQISSVPMDTSCNSVQAAQPLPGPSSQTSHSQNQVNSVGQEEEESTEEDDNTDDDGDAEEGLPVKEESEEDVNTNRSIEPTTFVNVSLACDEAGPSGLQQQKISEMPEMTISQTTDGDPKSGGPMVATKHRRIFIITQKTEVDIKEKQLKPTRNVEVEDNYTSESSVFIKEEILEEDVDIKEKQFKSIRNIEVEDNCTSESSSSFINEENTKEDVDEVLKKLRNTCPFCEKSFLNEKKVLRHVRHNHQRPNKCNMCRKSYFTVKALEEHQKYHNSNLFFECNICNLKYKCKQALKHHQIRIHSNLDSKYICDYCGKCYKLKRDLILHIGRVHMTNFQICRFCGKSVKDLTTHEWRHEKRTKNVGLNFSCHLCTKKFRTRTYLENHLLMHKKEYKCNECDKIFKGPNQLANHKSQSHKPAKICKICEKIFRSGSNFYQHVLTHAGIRPYKCDICGEDFTQRSSLLRHRKNHPGPLPALVQPMPIANLAKNILQKF